VLYDEMLLQDVSIQLLCTNSVVRFSMSCVHFPGAVDTVADALSRDNFDVVHSFLPQGSPECVPAAIVELLVTTRPDWGSSAWMDLFTRSLAGVLQTPH